MRRKSRPVFPACFSSSFWRRAWQSRPRRPQSVPLHLEQMETRIAPASFGLLHTFNDPNGVAGDSFGSTVAAVGSDVLVGAPGANGNSGTAYLYDSSGNLLHAFAGNGVVDGGFGPSVAVVGSDVLVGAPGVNGALVANGAAYLYDSSGNLLHTFLDPNNGDFDLFGFSVAAVGSDVLVGALGATAAPLRTCTTLRASCCKPSPAPAVSSLPCRWWGATCWWGHQGSRTCTTPRAICCTPSPTPTELPTTVSALPRRRWGATCWWGQMGSTASAALRTCTTPRAICCTPLPTPTELPTTVSALPCRRWGTTWWWGQMGSTAPAARRTCTRASRTSGPATVPTTFGATRTTGPATPSLRPGMIWFSRAAPSRKPASMILGSLLIRSRLRTPIAFPGSP